MSDDKLDQILAKLEAMEAAQGEQGVRIDAIAKRQADDFGMLTGALETLSTNLADVNADLGDAIRRVEGKADQTNRLIAQLRAEHGGYLRAVQNEVKGIDQRVAALEGKA